MCKIHRFVNHPLPTARTLMRSQSPKMAECKHANLGCISIAFSFVQHTDAGSSKRDASVRCLQSAHHLGEELCSWLQLYICQCKDCTHCSSPIILRHARCRHCRQNIRRRRWNERSACRTKVCVQLKHPATCSNMNSDCQRLTGNSLSSLLGDTSLSMHCMV